MSETNSPNLCCCCSLKTGGIIIGALGIIGGIILAIISIMQFGAGAFIKEITEESHNGGGFSSKDSAEEVLVTPTTMLNIFASITLILALVAIALAVVLFYGINKKSPHLLKIWIVFQTIFLILFVIATILEYSVSRTINWPADVIVLVLSFWFIAVIHYLRKEFQAVNLTQQVHYTA